jgi:2-oxoglutarate dehydrogenase E1 component
MLKFRPASSDIEDFGAGKRFKRVIEDTNADSVTDDKIRKVLYCSGQVYYDLEAKRQKEGVNDVAIVRVEQIAPFPYRSLRPSAKKYKNAEHCWVQEEPKNAGCWNFIEPRFRAHFKEQGTKATKISYAGRPISASTATGYGAQHSAELANLL